MEGIIAIQQLLNFAARSANKDRVQKSEEQKRGERFNVFHVCKVDYNETLHSAILAEWLNPLGTHGQRDLFLRLFIHKIDSSFAQQFCSSSAIVSTEFSITEGRIDILLEDTKGKAIIIENKIYAEDQDKQLIRYSKFAENRYGEGAYRLYYLTLDGRDATDKSGKGVQYTPISYRDHVINWLDECIKESVDKPFLRESLIQYKLLVKQMTGRDMDNTIERELVDRMLQTPESVVAIIKAYPVWEKSILEESLFRPLKKFAQERNLLFGINDKFWSKNAWGRFWFEVEPGLLIVFEYEKQGRNRFYYGVTDGRPNRKEMKNLPGLIGGNDGWRYGWRYFDMHPNWTIDDILEIALDGGAFFRYISDVVDNLLRSMIDNGII